MLLWAGLSRIVLDLLKSTSSLLYMYGIREVSVRPAEEIKNWEETLGLVYQSFIAKALLLRTIFLGLFLDFV